LPHNYNRYKLDLPHNYNVNHSFIVNYLTIFYADFTNSWTNYLKKERM